MRGAGTGDYSNACIINAKQKPFWNIRWRGALGVLPDIGQVSLIMSARPWQRLPNVGW